MGHGVAAGERRIELELQERHVALGYSLGLATGPEKADLEAAHDRGAESARLDALTERLERGLSICTGESEAGLECRAPDKRELESIGASGWGTDTLTVEWRYRIPLRHRALKLTDSWQRDDIARTDVAIRSLVTRAPLRAGPDSPKAVELEFAFDDRLLAGAPRVVFVELPPEPTRGRTLLVSVAALAAVAAFVAILFTRRRGAAPR